MQLLYAEAIFLSMTGLHNANGCSAISIGCSSGISYNIKLMLPYVQNIVRELAIYNFSRGSVVDAARALRGHARREHKHFLLSANDDDAAI